MANNQTSTLQDPSLNLTTFAAFTEIAAELRDKTTGQVGSLAIPAGWALVDRVDAPGGTTYHGYAFQNVTTGTVIIVSAPLDASSPSDVANTVPPVTVANIQSLSSLTTNLPEFNQAYLFAQKVISEFGGNNNVVVDGLSKGGADADYISAMIPGITGVAFGPPGIAPFLDPANRTADIINFIRPDDAIGTYGTHVGLDVQVQVGADFQTGVVDGGTLSQSVALLVTNGISPHHMFTGYAPALGLDLSNVPAPSSGFNGVGWGVAFAGDTLDSLASRFGVSANLLAAANPDLPQTFTSLTAVLVPVEVSSIGSTATLLNFSAGDPRTVFVDAATGQVAYMLTHRSRSRA